MLVLRPACDPRRGTYAFHLDGVVGVNGVTCLRTTATTIPTRPNRAYAVVESRTWTVAAEMSTTTLASTEMDHRLRSLVTIDSPMASTQTKDKAIEIMSYLISPMPGTVGVA